MTATLQLSRSLERPAFEAASALWTPESAVATSEWLDSHNLAVQFDQRNEALEVPAETRARTNELLWVLGEHDARTTDHGRRVGGYMEAALHAFGDPEYDDDHHAGILRISGAVHDIGKRFVDSDTLHRSWGDPGYGPFDKVADMARIRPHAQHAYNILYDESALPVEARFIGGCHHQFTDPTQPENPIYGTPLKAIDAVFAHDPKMRLWVHLAVQLAVAADVFDAATSRSNTYLTPDAKVYDYTVQRLQNLPLLSERSDKILSAMVQEQVRYLRLLSSAGSPQHAA